MSSTLSCTFRVQVTRSAQYWWLLVFEAMRRIDCTFDKPDRLPEHRGNVYAVDRETGEDFEGSGVSFREAWEALQTYSNARVEYWPASGGSFKLKASVGMPMNSEQTRIWLSIPVESLAVDSLPDKHDANTDNTSSHETGNRVQKWLGGVVELYELCGPCTGSLSWERWGSEYCVGTIGEMNEMSEADILLRTARLVGIAEPLRIIERPLAYGSVLRVVDPLPLPAHGKWTAVTLVS